MFKTTERRLRWQDMDYMQQARCLNRFLEKNGLSQQQAARRLGMSQSAVANKLRLLKHPPQVLEALRAAGLTERHARTLLRLPAEQRLEAVAVITHLGYTVAQTEQYIETILS